MTTDPAVNALTSAIDCVQKEIIAGNRGQIILNLENVRPYDDLDQAFNAYAMQREE